MANMQIIIPGALPPSPVATELIGHLEKACPELVACFNSMSATRIEMPVETLGCTPYEAVMLRQLGYQGDLGHKIGAGLAPLRAGATQNEDSVLIAELCNIDIGTNGAQITHPATLNISQDEADALFDAVSGLWEGSSLSILPVGLNRWRVWISNMDAFDSISPHALHGLALRDWLPQDEFLKPWRRLLNEIQTVWHDHPVNQARADRQELPVNSLWLYGGARGWKPNRSDHASMVFEDLLLPHALEDWAAWLKAMPRLTEFLRQAPTQVDMTLLGDQHAIELAPINRAWWQRLWPARQQNWKSWWNLQS
ncbi:MAG TPA: hypothetical protein DDY24_00725 [Alcaligenaceae bacterium]|nr:hypothetical protein [Alcaligenaceae bacterium]